MMETLNGKHAVVTGASRGIGLAVARTLAAHGARVTLMARDEAALAEAALALGGAVAWQVVDVADLDSVGAAFARAGTVDILVNNAGQAASAPFGRTDAALWQRMLDVNLTGAYHCIQAALPGMVDKGWGRIVNVASTAGLTGYRYVAAYCAAKHGLVGLTRALALEVAAKGVTVNAVCPGFTETDIVRDAVATIVRTTGRTVAEARAQLASANPQGRLVQPDEVAHAVAWLCMPGASALNGQAVAVAGGEVM
ncbi:SDR family oxidoreductase [Massilia pinisoli]|uniref:SDR family oxidoreductase n=1 Tax=Massilia pinisoli TaxID=1772194 RepID=A0ABT1ZKH6_9BURK|nr:SDR family NAD(P)-dependent oxidoreductase [Massilia pinisoli]MCS0580380.1 SDR family oxidoreductase [Massilia pinisoli]